MLSSVNANSLNMDINVHVSYMLCRRLNTLLLYWLLDIPVELATYTLTCCLPYSLHTSLSVISCCGGYSRPHSLLLCFMYRLLYTCLLLGAFENSRRANISFFISVLPSHLSAWNNSVPTKRIFTQIDI